MKQIEDLAREVEWGERPQEDLALAQKLKTLTRKLTQCQREIEVLGFETYGRMAAHVGTVSAAADSAHAELVRILKQ